MPSYPSERCSMPRREVALASTVLAGIVLTKLTGLYGEADLSEDAKSCTVDQYQSRRNRTVEKRPEMRGTIMQGGRVAYRSKCGSRLRVGLAVCIAMLAHSPAFAEAPGAYMQRVMNELVAAQRAGTVTAFSSVLRKHMDVQSIGLRALGPHASALPKPDRPSYYSAMINFIGKYAAKESPKYRVTAAVVTGQSAESAGGATVDTNISVDGSPYDVRWNLVRTGQSFKVRDAQVLGFWVSSSLDTLFQNYITENGNNPRALVVALNRY